MIWSRFAELFGNVVGIYDRGAVVVLKEPVENGQPGGTRTPYPELRRFVLYPDELLAVLEWRF